MKLCEHIVHIFVLLNIEVSFMWAGSVAHFVIIVSLSFHLSRNNFFQITTQSNKLNLLLPLTEVVLDTTYVVLLFILVVPLIKYRHWALRAFRGKYTNAYRHG